MRSLIVIEQKETRASLVAQRDSLKDLERFSKPMYVSPLEFAFVYYGLGDRERWQRAMTEAFHERIGGLVFLEVWPQFDAMRSDPFFQELSRKIGLP